MHKIPFTPYSHMPKTGKTNVIREHNLKFNRITFPLLRL